MEGTPRPGQFAVTKTGGWAARLIQIVTASEVNHALICVEGEGDDAVCVEAQPDGARRTRAGNYPDAIWSDFDLTDEEIHNISQWAIQHIGTPYGWLDCVAAGLDALHQRFPAFPDFKWVARRIDSLDTMDCSQLVTMDYTNAGFALCPDLYPSQVSPGDLYRALVIFKSLHLTRPPRAER